MKSRSTIWSSNPTLGYVSKGDKNRILKRYLLSHVYYSIIHASQNTDTQTCLPMDECMKRCVIETYNGILFSCELEGSPDIWLNMGAFCELAAASPPTPSPHGGGSWEFFSSQGSKIAAGLGGLCPVGCVRSGLSFPCSGCRRHSKQLHACPLRL